MKHKTITLNLSQEEIEMINEIREAKEYLEFNPLFKSFDIPGETVCVLEKKLPVLLSLKEKGYIKDVVSKHFGGGFIYYTAIV